MAEEKKPLPLKTNGPEVHSEPIRKPIIKRFKEAFFTAKPRDIADALVDKVLFPTLQDMLAESIYTFVDVAVYHREPVARHGGLRGSRGTLLGGPLNYNKASETARFARSKTATGYIFRNLSWASIEECNIVWERMLAIYEQYGVVTVHQFYDAAERTADYTDDYYGWTSLDDCGYGIEDGRYYLELPDPVLLKK